MAVEDILKNAKKRTKKARKHIGGVDATDERYTGLEPVWDNWSSWPKEKFHAERSRAFNFYNYYQDSKAMKPRVLEWMESNGYSKEDISAVRRTADYLPGVTTGTLCTCMLRGMPEKHPELDYTSDREFVDTSIRNTISIGRSMAREASKGDSGSPAAPAVSPMELLRNKATRTIIWDLDLMLDSWILKKEYEPIDIYARMQHHGLSAMACATVEQFLTRHMTEIQKALDGSDPYLVEVYQNEPKPALKKKVQSFEKMLADLERFRHAAKATRAPREKKPISAQKQIAKLKYCKENAEHKIASIDPQRIVGAYRLLAFNVKYRMLIDYVAQNEKGLSIKGTTLQNVDESNTRSIRLRKPDEFLPIVLGSTAKQINKAWEKLTTKESKPNARIGSEVVLLRVFERRDV